MILKYSIILPCYNCENFVERAIDSCIGQQIPKNQFELIFINDGSTDHSLNIALNKRKGLSYFTIIDQENKGLGYSRNIGIKKAKGTYILFLDADDALDQKALFNLDRCIKKDVEMIFLNYKRHLKKGNQFHQHAKLLSNKKRLLKNPKKVLIGSPFYCYQRAFLIKNNLLFHEEYLHEDFHLLPQILLRVKKYQLTDFIFYHYYINSSSITHTRHAQRIEDLLKIARDFGEMLLYSRNNQEHYFIQDFFFASIKSALELAYKLPLNQFKNAYIKLKGQKLFETYLTSPRTFAQNYLYQVYRVFGGNYLIYFMALKLYVFSIKCINFSLNSKLIVMKRLKLIFRYTAESLYTFQAVVF